MIQSVSHSDLETMSIIDEVEKVGRAKVRKVIQFLFAEVCYRKALDKFHCEGCAKDWPSQRDHECCLRSPYEIFDKHYDDVKQRVNLHALKNLCKLFGELADIPITLEWNQWIESLPNQSSYTVYWFWQTLRECSDDVNEAIVDFVDMLCDNMDDETKWSTGIHLRFESFMMQ